ncbi:MULTISPECIES: shikimate dehydrogenase [unclassified Lentimonas]|uniref:shikimate dehydrogenase family protein n=1 Tax=unclassified Lentimonas TaxID=2630993 RepID=UPI0013253378|nr:MULTISPECIES: shikimate dehydrogenase [unclassified Lentimonas]CAA6689626.1 Shikimate 5-dehydrogenase I alpha (EC [Lentimonas sp. CC10]CAA6691908.1 Shikimate 5-dehydrogenase I alpha (EC [Lentimonas sp. CC19]CAA7072165.1 Shikimate 5-dehydrogenase I alpha (EC [Lentimonas sp. CC11]
MDTEKTYTLRDLEATEFSGTPLAVIGHPIKHSVSPAMHNAALAKLRKVDSRFIDWAYYRFDIAPEDFAQALPLFHQRNFLGLNLTIPHKVQAMDLIKGVSPDAEVAGAVNTLVWGELGYDGFNTDGYGLSKALELDLGVSLKGANVMLLGSGGAARGAAVQCVLEECAQLYVGNRTPSRLQELMDVIGGMSGGERAQTFAFSQLPEDLPEQGVVVNATSLGLKEGDPAPIDVSRLPSGWKVYDMIYNPLTALLVQAHAENLPIANGLSMLVHQGARSLEIWSHSVVDAHAMMTAACHALNLPPRND